jgi:hypothetical protein
MQAQFTKDFIQYRIMASNVIRCIWSLNYQEIIKEVKGLWKPGSPKISYNTGLWYPTSYAVFEVWTINQ